MKKTLLICSGFVILTPLICIGANITHKVGAVISSPLIVKNIQNLSFGIWSPSDVSIINIYINSDSTVGKNIGNNEVTPLQTGHAGIIKITGYGNIAIQSSPPTALVHTTDSTKTLALSNMKIVNSDGSNISNMNKFFINSEIELKTIGTMTIPKASEVIKGEYTADWPITIVYAGYELE